MVLAGSFMYGSEYGPKVLKAQMDIVQVEYRLRVGQTQRLLPSPLNLETSEDSM